MDRILERKYGMSAEQAREANQQMTALAAGVGLEYHLDRVQAGNTFDAHRLIHLAATHGLGDALKERLLAAYFTEGRSVGDPDHAGRAGGARWAWTRPRWSATLAGEDFAADVRADEARATALGATGVPFFVIDETYGVAGAQGADVLLGALERAWSESHPVTLLDAEAAPTVGPAATGPAASDRSDPVAAGPRLRQACTCP